MPQTIGKEVTMGTKDRYKHEKKKKPQKSLKERRSAKKEKKKERI